jgi:hypothetical protein
MVNLKKLIGTSENLTECRIKGYHYNWVRLCSYQEYRFQIPLPIFPKLDGES